MKTINCDSCHQPMRLVKKGRSRKLKRSTRIRRFHCDLCDITTTIFADGYRDLIQEPLDTSIKAGNINSSGEQEKMEEHLDKTICR